MSGYWKVGSDASKRVWVETENGQQTSSPESQMTDPTNKTPRTDALCKERQISPQRADDAGALAYLARYLERALAAKEKELEGLREDAMTMALRLYGESDDTFAPETIEVMSRWRLKCNALFQEHADQKDKLYEAMERS